ncbi:hypothetical protein HXX76_006939 [Chlamydomonas incerta]|uniref:Peptidase S8/S53 domain-containing protein n=1 Tax=Chlamydomonas incerta TaxID=51695 RepID=A0A835SYY2_CHLIN|nr:hypothetical protein HXX76_006939 [Chlamydomonas incerta]|eukprot:KAG2435743.1 hypothetical protein HXX76_006939 [Chlamydomonas incerta]
MASWALTVVGLGLACVGAAALSRAICRRTPPGLLRLFLLVPAAALFVTAPLAFEVQSASRASAAAMLMWLATFKLLALGCGRSPLAVSLRQLSLGQFCALLLWPVIPVTGPGGTVTFEPTHGWARARKALGYLVWRLPENLVVTLVAIYTLTHPGVPLFPKTYSAAFGVCAYCSLWANACAALVVAVHGLALAPSWDRPWLQTSLADFWGRRWNLPAAASLKHLVFAPVVEGRLVPKPRPRLAAAGEDLAPAGAAAAAPGDDSSPPAVGKSPPPSSPSTASDSASRAGAPLNAPETADDVAAAAPPGDGGAGKQRAGGETAPPGAPGTGDVAATERRGHTKSRRDGPSAAARLMALSATFAVSGLMHEVLLWVCTGDASQLGKQTWFFAIQAPLMLAEQALVRAAARAGIQLPVWLCIPVASLTLQVPAMYGFWGAYFAAVTPRSTPLSAPGAASATGATVPAFGAGGSMQAGAAFGALKLQQLKEYKEPPHRLRDWIHQRPGTFGCLVFLLITCIVLVAVVPPVCVLVGCGAGRPSDSSDSESINRLIVNFDQIGKTVKSKIPPLLYDYLEEVALKSGIQIVSFSDAKVLEEVKKILLTQPDLANLLQDSAQSRPPVQDPLAALAGAAGAAGVPGTRRFMSALDPRRFLQSVTVVPGAPDPLDQYALGIVKARDAWNVTQGTPEVIVAVVDTGCDLSHPDLKDNLWINTKEIPGNGVDDDGNGLIDDVYGYDFAGTCENDYPSDGCGPKSDPQDTGTHGSHCAGIVGAVRNNGVGISGIAPRVKIMCLKVSTPSNNFYTAHILKAYDYAYRMGAHVVSCSFGPAEPNMKTISADELAAYVAERNLYRAALQPMVDKNMLIIAAAGNENTNLDQLDQFNTTYMPCFMAKEFPENMLCVTATNQEDVRWAEIANNKPVGSNFGIKYADIGAPGRMIMSSTPPVAGNSMTRWNLKTGSSMATPMVSGIGALVISVLGTGTGNYFQGKEARKIIVESADPKVGLPVSTGRRVNAANAVRQATAKLSGVAGIVTDASFVRSSQSVLVTGFNETYYAGDYGITERNDWDQLPVRGVSTRPGLPRFERYKFGAGTTLRMKASVYLPLTGLYAMQINTTASPADLRVLVGQVALNLSAVNLLNSNGGWYEFEMRYRNPSAVIDIQMAQPTGQPGASSSAFSRMTNFYVSTPVPPKDYYWAPKIALSSTWQVLTRPVDANTVGPASILESALQLDGQFNFSSVVPDINFTMPSALRATLYPGAVVAAADVPKALVGVAHTRLAAPDKPMRFKLTCAYCSMAVNGLRILDVYDFAGTGAAVTRISDCITFGNASGTHDILVRFAAADSTAAPLALGWLPCDANPAAEAVSLSTHVMNNLFWKPSSGVAGYVPGLQCDVWPSTNRVGPAIYKFRLPAAMASTPRALQKNLTGPKDNRALFDDFLRTGCSAAEDKAPGCIGPAMFRFADTIVNWPNSTTITNTALAALYMRCWTFVNRGFKQGFTALPMVNNNIYGYMGAQTVLRLEVTAGVPSQPPSSPNVTQLNDHYQLLAVEWRGLGAATALVGIVNAAATNISLNLDMNNTLLPIPVVAARTPATVSFDYSAVAVDPTTIPSPPYPSPSRPARPSWPTFPGQLAAETLAPSPALGPALSPAPAPATANATSNVTANSTTPANATAPAPAPAPSPAPAPAPSPAPVYANGSSPAPSTSSNATIASNASSPAPAPSPAPATAPLPAPPPSPAPAPDGTGGAGNGTANGTSGATNGTSTSGATNGTSTSGATNGTNGTSTSGATNGTSTSTSGATNGTNGTSTSGATNGTSTSGATNGTSTSTATNGTSTSGATNGTSTSGTTNGTSTSTATNGTSTSGATNGTSTSGATNGTSTSDATNGTSTSGATNGTSTAAGRHLLQLQESSSGFAAVALGASVWSLRQVDTASPGLRADVYNPTSTAPYDTVEYLSKLVLNNISFVNDTTIFGSVVSPTVGLSGPLPGKPPASIFTDGVKPPKGPTPKIEWRARYVRAAGFLYPPQRAAVLTRWVVKVVEQTNQSTSVTFGDVTIRNAIEFPSTTVRETSVPVWLPPGYVPMVVMARSSRTDAAAAYDISLIDAAGVETDVTGDRWYRSV